MRAKILKDVREGLVELYPGVNYKFERSLSGAYYLSSDCGKISQMAIDYVCRCGYYFVAVDFNRNLVLFVK